MSNARKNSALDWKPWMSVALAFSGILAVAAWAGPRTANAAPPNPKK